MCSPYDSVILQITETHAHMHQQSNKNIPKNSRPNSSKQGKVHIPITVERTDCGIVTSGIVESNEKEKNKLHEHVEWKEAIHKRVPTEQLCKQQ